MVNIINKRNVNILLFIDSSWKIYLKKFLKIVFNLPYFWIVSPFIIPIPKGRLDINDLNDIIIYTFYPREGKGPLCLI